MADTGARRVERQDFHDNDPFAELTRIMGHDPRRVDDVAGERGDEFGVDLEQELLGRLDLGEAETGQAEQPVENADPVAEEIVHEQPEAEIPADLQADEATWSAMDRRGEELFAEQADADDFAEDLDAAISADLASQMEAAAGEADDGLASVMAVSHEEAPASFDGEAAHSADEDASLVEAALASSLMEDMTGAEYPHDETEGVEAAHSAEEDASLVEAALASSLMEDVADAEHSHDETEGAEAAHSAEEDNSLAEAALASSLMDDMEGAEYPHDEAESAEAAHSAEEDASLAEAALASSPMDDMAGAEYPHDEAERAEAAHSAEEDASLVEGALASSLMEDMEGAEYPQDEAERAEAAHSDASASHHDGPEEVQAGDGLEEAEWLTEALEADMLAATPPVDTVDDDAADQADSAQPVSFAPHPEAEDEGVAAFAEPAAVEPAEPAQFTPGDYSSLEDELTALLADGRQPAESDGAMPGAQPDPRDLVPGADGEPHGQEAEQATASPAEQQASDPFAALALLGASGHDRQDAASPAQEMRGSGADAGVPEIETVDIDDGRPPQLGDLQIPDLPNEEPVTPAAELDDLEAELDRAFDFMNSRNHADEPMADNLADPGQDWDEGQANPDWTGADAYPGEDENRWAGTAIYAAGAMAQGAASAERLPDEANRYDDFDAQQHYAPDYAPADVATASEVPPPPRRVDSGRRGVVIAAAVVAVALLGGVGVYFMSSGGQVGGDPVLLRADADPVRVRPEDPGGAVVPNQDSQVYERVAGGGEDAEPTQQQLVDTTEEPIELDEPGSLATVPGLSDEEGGVEAAAGEAGDGPVIATAKAEDRVGSASETIVSASDDFVAVQPRRVRTMIVRPDGTMVPREETEAANTSDAEAPGAALSAASPGLSTAPSSGGDQLQVALAPVAPTGDAATVSGQAPTESAAAPEATAEEAQAADTTPPVDGAPRSRPADAAPATEAVSTTPTTGTTTQQDPPQQEQQVAAVAPTPAPAPTSTASGEWSMQIASQPSADSAQVTYQDLARRYSSLLEGRGVNIVRAEIEGRGTYYRVRIPMDTRDEAINLCTRYKAAGGSCFVSR